MLQKLEARLEERARLLEQVEKMLEQDERVTNAWMYGSLGKGTDDVWSDLDVWVVLEDSAYPAVEEGRRDFVRRLGEPLIWVEAPHNGPPGGTWLMSVYDAPTGPHMIDWRFQPFRSAWKPETQRVLIDRRPLPTPEGDVPFNGTATWQPTPEQQDANRAAMFWIMTLVQGKCIARDPVAKGLTFEAFILNFVREVAEFRGENVVIDPNHDLVDVKEKILTLQGHAAKVAEVAPEHSAPFEPVTRFLDLVLECAYPGHCRAVY